MVNILAGEKQFLHCREVAHFSDCPLLQKMHPFQGGPMSALNIASELISQHLFLRACHAPRPS